MHYDPKLAEPFRKNPAQADVEVWSIYDAIRCPVLLLRGAESDLLQHKTAETMTQRGPHAKLVEFEGVGHAPMLMDEGQIKFVREFLLAG